MRRVAPLLALGLLCVWRVEARDNCPPPVVIPGVKGNLTTTKFGNGYITRSSDGTSTTTRRFGDGTISSSTTGAGATTSKFAATVTSRGKTGGAEPTPVRSG